MDLEIGSINQGGVVLDIAPYDLSPQIFSYAENVEFGKQGVTPLLSPINLYLTLPLGKTVLHAEPATVNGGIKIVVFFCEDKIFILDRGNLLDVTPSGLGASRLWSVVQFNGYVVACNGVNYPYYLDFYNYTAQLAVLPNWPTNVLPKLLGCLAGCLFAFGNGSQYLFSDQFVLWSNIAEIGQLPSNYDYTDPTSRAGLLNLPDYEYFVSVESLGQSLVLYRSNSVYTVRFVGGGSVFSFTPTFSDKSLLSEKAVATKGRLHYCIDQGEFYVHDGLTTQEFDAKPVSDYFYKNVNLDRLDLVQMFYDKVQDKLHLVYPSKTSSVCDFDLFYNFSTQTWSIDRVPSCTYVAPIFLPNAEDNVTYDGLEGTYDEWEGTYELEYANLNRPALAYFGSEVYTLEGATEYKVALLRRNLVAYTVQDQSGAVTVKRNLQVLITELWPKLYDGTVSFRIGFSDKPLSEISWSDWQLADDFKLDFFESGRYLHVEIKNEDQQYFNLGGYMLRARPIGEQ